MSKKISEFFKATPKEQNSSNCGKISEIKAENLPEIRDCQVIIKDIKNQFQKEPKMFDEISLKDSDTKVIKKGGKVCKFCGKELSKSGLHYHLKIVHASLFKFISCLICNMKFKRQKSLDTHMKKKHPNGQAEHFECDFDGKVFTSKKGIFYHMKAHLPDIECHICHKIVKFSSLKIHLKDTHATDNRFQCKICSKKFKAVLNLHQHEKSHDKKFQCEICQNMQPSQSKLNRHIKLYHKNTEIYKCEKCFKDFKLKNSYTKHQKTHDKNRQKAFKCHRCDFATDTKQHYDKHQEFHERRDKKFAEMKNPLKCEKCPTFHRNKYSLKNHMKHVHPKTKFQCDLCAKFLKSKTNLKYHMNVHISRISLEKVK